MDEQLKFIEQIASSTFYRRDDDKFSFLWDTQVVLLYYNEDSNMFRIISDHEPQILSEINTWLKVTIKSNGGLGSEGLEAIEEF